MRFGTGTNPNESFDGLGYFNVDVPEATNHLRQKPYQTTGSGYKVWRISRSPPPAPSCSPVDDPYRYSSSSAGGRQSVESNGAEWRRNDSVNRLRYSSGDPNLVRFAEYNRVKDASVCARERPQQYQIPPWDPSYTRRYLQEAMARQHRGRCRRRNGEQGQQRSKSASAAKRHGSMVSSYAQDYGVKARQTAPLTKKSTEAAPENKSWNQAPEDDWEGAKPFPVYAMQPAGNESDIEPLQLNQLESLEDEVGDNESFDESKNPLQRELEEHCRTAKQRFLHHFYSNSVAPLLGVGQQFLSRTYPVRVTERQKMKRKYRHKGYLPGDYGDAEGPYTSERELFTSQDGNWMSLHQHKFNAASETQARYSDPWKLAMRQWRSAEIEEDRSAQPESHSRREGCDSQSKTSPELSLSRAQQESFTPSSSQQRRVYHNTPSARARDSGKQTNTAEDSSLTRFTPAERYSQHLYNIKNSPHRLSQLHDRHRDLDAKRSFLKWRDTQMRQRNTAEKQYKGKLEQVSSTHGRSLKRAPEAKPKGHSGNTYREALANALRNQLPADYF
eukprot:gb/GECG01013484.1/.p1 GENE.gb/GECG01013484.1/~~gb/GECG01013484.1/.p1  ORF type:complete len:558 (+),score=69.03 gb/GECG01013484.1/:1-1674(+)